MNEKEVGSKKAKVLALYQWKLNACFDETTSKKLIRNLKDLDKNW